MSCFTLIFFYLQNVLSIIEKRLFSSTSEAIFETKVFRILSF